MRPASNAYLDVHKHEAFRQYAYVYVQSTQMPASPMDHQVCSSDYCKEKTDLHKALGAAYPSTLVWTLASVKHDVTLQVDLSRETRAAAIKVTCMPVCGTFIV